MSVCTFCFYREPVLTCGSHFFSPFVFVCYRFNASNDFVCVSFTWIAVPLSWYSFTNALFSFLMYFGLPCRSGLPCLSSSLFTCLAYHVQPYELFCRLFRWRSRFFLDFLRDCRQSSLSVVHLATFGSRVFL